MAQREAREETNRAGRIDRGEREKGERKSREGAGGDE